jgi:superoxide dismutase, Fe-Mn family
MIQQTSLSLPPLPYAENSLEPFISAKTISFHYGKHHKAYIDNANKLLENEPELATYPTEDIIIKTAEIAEKTGLFNNVAQAWNHTFYWESLQPKGGAAPKGRLLELIKDSFGDVASLTKKLSEVALSQFGSGWAWVVMEKGKLAITKTSNADNPLTKGQHPLLTIDVWEHAYYLDYQNLRAKYLEAVTQNLLNWEFAQRNLDGSK